MATITKIFKPRRGLKSTMYGGKASTVLSSGEMFVECQSSTVGHGKIKLKIGDGSTAYSSLDYALGDTSTDPISFSNNGSSTASAALNSVASGNSLQTIIGGLKQTMSLNASSINNLNNEKNRLNTQLNGLYFTKDSSGNWGYKIGAAGSVIPFSTNAEIRSALPVGKEITVNYPKSGYWSPYGETLDSDNTSGSSTFTVTYNNGGIVYLIEKNNVKSRRTGNRPSDSINFEGSVTVNGKQYFGWVTYPFRRYIELFTTIENRKRDYAYYADGSGIYGESCYVLTDGSMSTTYPTGGFRFYYSMLILVP